MSEDNRRTSDATSRNSTTYVSDEANGGSDYPIARCVCVRLPHDRGCPVGEREEPRGDGPLTDAEKAASAPYHWEPGRGLRPGDASPGLWRTGTKIGNTIYYGDVFTGSCVTPEMAMCLVADANAGGPRLDGRVIGTMHGDCRLVPEAEYQELLRLRSEAAKPDWKDHYARVASALGITHDAEGQGSWPGPIEAVLQQIEGLKAAQNELIDRDLADGCTACDIGSDGSGACDPSHSFAKNCKERRTAEAKPDHLECAGCHCWSPGGDKPPAWTEESGLHYCYECSVKRQRCASQPGDPTVRHVVAWMRATYPMNQHAREWADEIDHVFLGAQRRERDQQGGSSVHEGSEGREAVHGHGRRDGVDSDDCAGVEDIGAVQGGRSPSVRREDGVGDQPDASLSTDGNHVATDRDGRGVASARNAWPAEQCKWEGCEKRRIDLSGYCADHPPVERETPNVGPRACWRCGGVRGVCSCESTEEAILGHVTPTEASARSSRAEPKCPTCAWVNYEHAADCPQTDANMLARAKTFLLTQPQEPDDAPLLAALLAAVRGETIESERQRIQDGLRHAARARGEFLDGQAVDIINGRASPFTRDESEKKP